MIEPLKGRKRSHRCGDLRPEHAGMKARLMGWAQRTRDHGGVLFLDLRDRYGITQVVFRPEQLDNEMMERARSIGSEYVVLVEGKVLRRPKGSENPEIPTGGVELEAESLSILNTSRTPPFPLDETVTASEDLRLRYRYLDLRREPLQTSLAFRHAMTRSVREFLSDHDFLEIETPMLVRPTPEGARDYVVPARLHSGKFYALPQSPQLYKQILMVSGFDRYFQIARCLRDEDLRADRQPEFTQIDLEMTFVTEDDVFEVVEGMLASVFRRDLGRELKIPFTRLTYRDSMERFGSDKPDLRIPFEIEDVTEVAGESAFEKFREAKAAAPGSMTGALAPRGLAGASRREIDAWEAAAKQMGVAGLAWARVKGGALDGGIAKHFSGDLVGRLIKAAGAEEGALLLLASGPRAVVQRALGHLRVQIGGSHGKLDPKDYRFVWVHQFPLFERLEERNAWAPAHHIFTMPLDEHLAHLTTDPGRVHAQLYDLAANGQELASGSIRIHRKDIQEKVMEVIGMTPEEAKEKFGFLLEAFEYGAPPHGGIALGLDRLVVLFHGGDSIRDAIAFPKTARATSLMDDAPAPIDPADLKELHLKILGSP
ncbi:MAG: aspartate--tRNA ligase [Candidatus Eisenbacteria bacterium]|uniref:Aspartate--tRNA(Asp/Asn) ligase n=1 Tax=Eiseniibacteriota bacterium TaxID=2212470 RepID=A0A538TIF1_UNCEI|nr:MAG: aspartate--tRNA ligase [Candidatus Eisenbacteria bacterium]